MFRPFGGPSCVDKRLGFRSLSGIWLIERMCLRWQVCYNSRKRELLGPHGLCAHAADFVPGHHAGSHQRGRLGFLVGHFIDRRHGLLQQLFSGHFLHLLFLITYEYYHTKYELSNNYLT